MIKATLTQATFEPATREFLAEINRSDAPPIYTLSSEEARKVLLKIQKDHPVSLAPAEIEDRVLPVGPRGEVSVKIVRPQNNYGTLPAVIYLHGGGWVLGDFQTHEHLVRQLANHAQSAVIFIDYARAPEAQYPIALEEAYEATRYLAENARLLKLDAERFAVMGDSAGATLAASLCLLAKDRLGPSITQQVLFYPVTSAGMNTASYEAFSNGFWLTSDAMRWFWDSYAPEPQLRQRPEVAPLEAPIERLQGLPPALIITAEYDVLRDEGEAYAHHLLEAGVPTTAVRMLGAVHDFAMLNVFAHNTTTQSAIKLAGDFLVGF